MKFKSLIIVGVVALLGARAQAQTDESRIKVLPTDKPGVVKVLYAMEVKEPLKVRFLTENQVVIADKIKGYYPKGILKRYDVRSISRKDFWVEISSPQMSVTYHVVPTKDKLKFASYLESTTYNTVLVKANN